MLQGFPAPRVRVVRYPPACDRTRVRREYADRVWEAGGKVVSDPISIPDGRFAYTLDPDGNSFGLFSA